MISELMDRQEAARATLHEILEKTDKSFGEAVLQTYEHEDILIAVTLALLETLGETQEPSEDHLLWGMEFIDHLDTLNFEVREKKQPKRKKHDKRGRR